jgi:hypothetical protein
VIGIVFFSYILERSISGFHRLHNAQGHFTTLFFVFKSLLSVLLMHEHDINSQLNCVLRFWNIFPRWKTASFYWLLSAKPTSGLEIIYCSACSSLKKGVRLCNCAHTWMKFMTIYLPRPKKFIPASTSYTDLHTQKVIYNLYNLQSVQTHFL